MGAKEESPVNHRTGRVADNVPDAGSVLATGRRAGGGGRGCARECVARQGGGSVWVWVWRMGEEFGRHGGEIGIALRCEPNYVISEQLVVILNNHPLTYKPVSPRKKKEP